MPESVIQFSQFFFLGGVRGGPGVGGGEMGGFLKNLVPNILGRSDFEVRVGGVTYAYVHVSGE
jgi:hypothetical protein